MENNIALIGLVIQGVAFLSGGLWFAFEVKSSNNIMKNEVRHIRESLDDVKDELKEITKSYGTQMNELKIRMARYEEKNGCC